MSQATENFTHLALAAPSPLAASLQRLGAALRSAVADARDRRAIAHLSARELEDAGIVAANRPTLEIKAGLMPYLMSLR